MAILTRIIRNSSLVLIIAFSFTSCGESSSSDEALGEEMSGEQIYKQKCTSCHGKNGDLGVSGAADLSKSSKSLEEKMDIISKGGPNGIMQAYGDKFGGPLNDQQVEKLATYIETLKN